MRKQRIKGASTQDYEYVLSKYEYQQAVLAIMEVESEMNDIDVVKDKLIDAQREIIELRAEVKQLQKKGEFHEYAISQWLTYEKDTQKEIEELRAELGDIVKLPNKLPGITREELLLASAWAAIKEDNSKAIHLEPRQAEALVEEHRRLKRSIHELQGEVAAMRTTLDAIGGSGWRDDGAEYPNLPKTP